jgi:hypothetical protein
MMHRLTVLVIGSLVALLNAASAFAAERPQVYLVFDGFTSLVEVADPPSQDLSASTTGQLTVSVWMRPDTLNFPTPERDRDGNSRGYVHWLGKGEGAGATGRQEWTFRMYSRDDPGVPPERKNRISFYLFNPEGGLGIGSYFDPAPIDPGQWIHVVATVDSRSISIFKDGEFKRCDQYQGTGDPRGCQQYVPDRWITPQHGTAPMRMGHRDRLSFFQGALAQIRIWNRELTRDEVLDLYNLNLVPPDGLVAEWMLNEGMGDTAHDTVNAYDGMIIAAEWGAG